MTLLRDETRADDEAASAAAPLVRYQDDAYSWALQQAALMRAGRLDRLDLEHLADEIADVAGREYDTFESALTRVIQHLLKWDHQPERRSRSWALSIKEHRERALDQLADHPGLKNEIDRAVSRAYRYGRIGALAETGPPGYDFPEQNVYDWMDIMGRPIAWPQDASATEEELP